MIGPKRKMGRFAHNTPGDGTGFSNLPSHSYPQDILDRRDGGELSTYDGTDTYGGSQPYSPQVTDPAHKGARK